VTAVFAHLVALPLPDAAQPILAPLTALPDVQVSLYQALRSAVHRSRPWPGSVRRGACSLARTAR
jgi:hypothetical protein